MGIFVEVMLLWLHKLRDSAIISMSPKTRPRGQMHTELEIALGDGWLSDADMASSPDKIISLRPCRREVLVSELDQETIGQAMD